MIHRIYISHKQFFFLHFMLYHTTYYMISNIHHKNNLPQHDLKGARVNNTGHILSLIIC